MRPPAIVAPFGLGVAGAALAGCACVALWPALPGIAAAWTMVALGLVLHARGDGAARVAGALLLGIAWAWLAADARLAARIDSGAVGHDHAVVGTVLGLPETDARSTRFDLRVDAAHGGGLAGRRLRLAWYHPVAIIEPGSRWSLRVRVRPPHGVVNPGGFDAERHAIAEGVDGSGTVRGDARRLAPGAGIDAWRGQLSGAIAARLDAPAARFVRALALGDTRGLDDGDWEILRATGLTHLIAISGFHVGLVAGLGAWGIAFAWRVFPTAGRSWPRPQAMAAGAFVFALGYTALAGFALPTVRTLLMIGAVLLARVLRRGHRAADAFALALLAVLAFDPLAVLAPGFWLSFAGVGWLLWCLSAPGEGRIRPFLAAQGVALAGLLPLVVGFFGQWSLVAPLTNAVAIPVISLGVVPLALAGTAALALPGPLAALLLGAAAALMEPLWSTMAWVAAWPGVLVAPAEAGATALVLSAVGAFWLLLPAGTPGRALGALLMLPLVWPAVPAPAAGTAQVTVLDVGQGLAVLVRTRDHALLYDAGPGGAGAFDHGAATVVPALHALGVRRLDAIVVSHGDGDHAGGLGAVRAAFPQARVVAPGGWAGPGMHDCAMQGSWRWDGVGFAFLHPPPHFPYLRNDSSCVLRIVAGAHVALLPGDIGVHVERRLLREAGALLRADLLLVPHHGSRSSSDPAFVAAAAPRLAVFASGADNRFALPRADIVQRYRAAGARVLGSAGNGAIGVTLGPDGLGEPVRLRQDRPRWWRERRRFVGAD